MPHDVSMRVGGIHSIHDDLTFHAARMSVKVTRDPTKKIFLEACNVAESSEIKLTWVH